VQNGIALASPSRAGLNLILKVGPTEETSRQRVSGSRDANLRAVGRRSKAIEDCR